MTCPPPPLHSSLNGGGTWSLRSEEHTSELQSQFHLVCRLLLEKKKLFAQYPPSPPNTLLHGVSLHAIAALLAASALLALRPRLLALTLPTDLLLCTGASSVRLP